MNTPVEDDLRAMLARQANTVPVRSDPYGLVNQRMATDRRRRLIAGAVAAALLILAGVVSAPMVTKLSSQDLAPAERSVSEWPTRGSLAGDPDSIGKALAARPEAVGNVRLLYAGVLGGLEVEVAMDDEGEVWAVTSPVGSGLTTTDAMLPAQLGNARDKKLFSFVAPLGGADDGNVFLFALAAPELDRVELSEELNYAENVPKALRFWDGLRAEDDAYFAQLWSDDGPSPRVRVRGLDHQRVVADLVPTVHVIPGEKNTQRLDQLAAQATLGHDLVYLGRALFELEKKYLGPDPIKTVEERWEKRNATQIFGGIAVTTTNGLEFELIVDNTGELLFARPVLQGTAWADQSAWPALPIPDSLRTTAEMDVPSTVGARRDY